MVPWNYIVTVNQHNILQTIFYEHIKHVEVDRHFIREKVDNKDNKLEYALIDDQYQVVRKRWSLNALSKLGRYLFANLKGSVKESLWTYL